MRIAWGLLLLSLSAAPAVVARSLSFGLKGGIPTEDAVRCGAFKSYRYTCESKPYTLGPVVEIRLRSRLSVETGALYRRIGYTREGGDLFPGMTERVKTRANSWQFPVAAKYWFPSTRISPYLGCGFSYQHLSDVETRTEAFTDEGMSVYPDLRTRELRATSNWGGIVVGGFETRAWKLRISPEIRYTRWGSDVFLSPSWSAGYDESIRSNRNQVDILLSITIAP